jgi:hypothetical protein
MEENKTIILAITPDVKLYHCFEDNLKFVGYDVEILTFHKKFIYSNLKDRILNFYQKKIKKNKSFKRSLVRKFNNESIINDLEKIKKSEYSLVIRADLFDLNTITKIHSLSQKKYAYQWDGLSRFKEVEGLIQLFDKFYIFDKKDLNNKYKTFPTTNFYFDCYPDLFKNKVEKYDVYFIGSYDIRISKLILICEILDKIGLKLNIILCCSPKKNLKKYKYISFINKPLNYFENLKNVSESKILIDISHDSLHDGLSFRTFEALGYNKKLITTNEITKNYDFYNRNNILCLNHNSINKIDIEKFLNQNYEQINEITKYKYSFSNWIKYILEMQDSIQINIP